jgi:hypothetical protein
MASSKVPSQSISFTECEKSREIDGSTEFFSIRQQTWLPLAGIIENFFPSNADRLAKFKETGLKSVKILRAGVRGECKVCRELAKGTYPIDNVPDIPPAECTCNPWSRLIITPEA